MSDHPAELSRLTTLARDAFSRGQAFADNGNKAEATRWLERAHRLAPGDGTIALALASAAIGSDNQRAASLFARVLTVADVREAWLGLATARLLMGDPDAARNALARALARHTVHFGMMGLADLVTRAAGATGWCGLTAADGLVIETINPEQTEIRIDGVVVEALPPEWPRARVITVMDAGERHLIGSPISARAIGAADGFVEFDEDGLQGWLWHPGAPETDPVLSVSANGAINLITATQGADGIPGLIPLARPRAFVIPREQLPAGAGPVRLYGRDGRDLLGSPVPGKYGGRSLPGRNDVAPASRPPSSVRPDIVVIVHGHESAGIGLETVGPDVRIVLRDSPTHNLERYGGRVTLLPGDIEPGHDVVLLDGGTAVPPGWLERLREAAYAAPDIGTVTPFSNRGVAAYPTAEGDDLSWLTTGRDTTDSQSFRRSVAWLDRLARDANGMRVVDMPYGGGPCVFIRGDCLSETGSPRAELFAQGDGALEDFCLRAAGAGWRHVALTGLFVGHPRSGDAAVPSAAAWGQLRARNTALLERLHPGLPARTAAFRSADPLAPARRRFDLARWRDLSRDKAGRDKPPREAAIFVTHDDGGGVALRVDDAVASQQEASRRAIVLRPSRMPDGTVAVTISDGNDRRFPNLCFALPAEKPALVRLLRDTNPAEAQFHHFLNHDPSVIEAVRALDIPYDVHIHDFAWFCPRIALVGRGDRYCGEPRPDACEVCVAETGSYLHEAISVIDLIARSRDILAGARRVIAPSQDTAARMEAHFPGLTLTIAPHEDDDAVDEPPPLPVVTGTVRVCVAGAIGLHKGFHVLLACARDARERGLDLTFVLVGTSMDDQSLLDTGKAFVTGRYEPEEAVTLIRSQGAALAFLPSIWPETWCLALTELWRAGLRVAAFDIGAPAERIHHTGRGFLLPLGMPPPAINNALLNAATGRSFLPIRRPSAYKPSNSIE